MGVEILIGNGYCPNSQTFLIKSGYDVFFVLACKYYVNIPGFFNFILSLIKKLKIKLISYQINNLKAMESNTTSASKEIRKFNCKLPKGVTIGKNQFGFCLFATEKFPKGTLVYKHEIISIPNEDFDIELITDIGTFPQNSIINGVKYTESERELYTYDCFVNHSCDPSTIPVRLTKEFEVWALKDIEPGDEINCDYHIFEYDCRDKGIEKCACGAEKCIGKAIGFKFLTNEQKKEKIKTVYPYMCHVWATDPDTEKDSLLYDNNLIVPENVEAVFSAEANSVHLVAKKNFDVGDVIYKNTSKFAKHDCIIIVSLLNTREWLEDSVHTVNRGELGREYRGIDSFRIYSDLKREEKNTTENYHDSNNYDVVAIKSIKPGERLIR
jgi:hypothetical protein